jgi:hypothetical protein
LPETLVSMPVLMLVVLLVVLLLLQWLGPCADVFTGHVACVAE